MPQGVDRAMRVLELLAREPAQLGDVAADLGVHKSTALRLLQTLEAGGFARRRDGGWTVGLRLIGLAQQALDSLDVRTVAHPHLAALGRDCGHTVHLAQLVDDELIYVDKIEARGQVRMYSRIGRTAPLHASGVGKVVLAFCPEPRLTGLLDRTELRAYTPGTICDPAALRAELAAVAARGWAADDGEFEPLITCVAAPVRLADGAVTAAVSVTAPTVVATLADLQRLLPRLLATTQRISRDLGWSGP
ncbi:IclR family transcriptional regulator [Micromonospora acroterricola]|uniref:IclR family transcriptional regulator n=1 Tax=Micromonospora acroterricola TaxID=2202421 RepID=A0A317DMU1_9ACTN|nr:IclR family transcriptional regulator [Micromonospora acroterricola]PWR14103.1 IclR family transcriptional regulator [Micromonospora acroterricola]